MITYKDVLDLGFKEEFVDDTVFFNRYGFDYSIITKDLAEGIFADWNKVDRKCYLIRVNETKDIIGRLPVETLDELKMYIEFFCGSFEMNVTYYNED